MGLFDLFKKKKSGPMYLYSDAEQLLEKFNEQDIAYRPVDPQRKSAIL